MLWLQNFNICKWCKFCTAVLMHISIILCTLKLSLSVYEIRIINVLSVFFLFILFLILHKPQSYRFKYSRVRQYQLHLPQKACDLDWSMRAWLLIPWSGKKSIDWKRSKASSIDLMLLTVWLKIYLSMECI